MQPLIGCLATAPDRETVLSRHEGAYLGNVDCGEITGGPLWSFPSRSQARGCTSEIAKRRWATVRLWPRPRSARGSSPRRGPCSARPRWALRVSTHDLLMTVVSGISLADASRAAFAELKLWLQDDWGLSSDQAAIVMGLGAHCGIGQVSNLLHTAKCSIARTLLPDGSGPIRAT